ncbi:MAG: DDE-type integrase/transposase/recombinase [Nanoarchaeota archaeon]|nr:DDE-type integrase/transposase/recombinase [Nanoarchaeota archaeon]
MKSKDIIQEKYKKVSCSKCSSNEIKKDGLRKTQNRGKIQRYRCRNCNFRFVIDDGFYRMRTNENKITVGIDLYYKGVSLRKVQEHFQAFYPHNSSHMSVYRWIVKYSMMVSNLTDNLPIQCGKEMMGDEMEYHRRLYHQKGMRGVEQNWFVDTFDLKTRFMIIGEYMKSRTNENLIKVMKKTRFKTGEQIKIVTTDGLQGYPRVLKKTFGLKTHWNHKSKIVHNVVIASERGFNHPIERVHNTIRERTKIMRGFHGCIESAHAIMKGLEINYNFNRKHMSLENKTPAEMAIIELKLGVNKWLELIKLSKI